MGYREYAKDYKIEYEDRPGRKRPKAVRAYIGPWYRFEQSPEKIRVLKWLYLIGLAVIAAALLVPMCIDCVFTRLWYIQVPAAAAWIPWVFAACATWRLWTAGEKVDREHNDMLGNRMSGACLFLMGLSLISTFGCFYAMVNLSTMAPADYMTCGCSMVAGIGGIVLFSRRKGLNMIPVEEK